MQEKFSVVLEAVTDGFKSKMNEVKSNVQESTVRMAELKREIQSLKSEMKYTDPGTRAFKEYAIAVDDATNELKQLETETKKASVQTNMFKTSADNMKTIGDGFKSMSRNILKYGLTMLSVRGILGTVRKASSAYLSADTELANKLQSAWAGLGAFLAPIIERIANMILKLVKYMNIFIKAVTGQDLLAKAANKATASIKKQTNATKALNKQLTAMDEITNIQKDETSGVGGAGVDTTPFDAFKDVKIDTKWADRIKEFGEWIRNNWQYVVAGLSGIALALAGLKLAMTGGTFSTFGRILSGIGLVVLGLTTFIYNLKQYIEDLNKGVENTTKGWQHFGLMISGIGVTVAGIGVIFASWPVVIAGAITGVIGLLSAFWPKIEGWLNDLQKTITSWAEKTFGPKLGNMISGPIVEAVQTWKNSFGGLLKSLKQIVNGIIKLFKGDLAGGLKSIFKGIGNYFISVLNGMISGINAFLTPFREVIVAAGEVIGKKISFSKTKIPKIPALATGTGYVPEDQMAYIHKGEAVIPKKFNSAEYFSNINNNEETNNLLLELNKTLLEVRDKPSTFNVNGKTLAQTTYKDFQNEGNRLGQSSIVTVR